MPKLPEAIRSGEVAWEMVHGKPFFDWIKDKPQENAIFSAAMNCASTLGEPPDPHPVPTCCSSGARDVLFLGRPEACRSLSLHLQGPRRPSVLGASTHYSGATPYSADPGFAAHGVDKAI